MPRSRGNPRRTHLTRRRPGPSRSGILTGLTLAAILGLAGCADDGATVGNTGSGSGSGSGSASHATATPTP